MNAGDPITYAYASTTQPPSYPSRLYLTAVLIVGPYGFWIDTTMPRLALEDEGTVWIRGHHTEQSEIGRALLAAFALARSRVA